VGGGGERAGGEGEREEVEKLGGRCDWVCEGGGGEGGWELWGARGV